MELDKRRIERLFEEIAEIEAMEDDFLDYISKSVEYLVNRKRTEGGKPPIHINRVERRDMDKENCAGRTLLTDVMATIFFPSGVSALEKRYIVSHELGHILLHSEFLPSGSSGPGKINVERDKEADYFAEVLLLSSFGCYETDKYKEGREKLKKAIDGMVIRSAAKAEYYREQESE